MKITVRTKRERHEFDCERDERILYAGLRAGIALPYECASGTCGTCKARARPGTVEPLWPDAPGARSLKGDRGEFLMCQARALGDCEMLVPQKVLQPGRGADRVPRHFRATVGRCRIVAPDVMTFALETEQDAIAFHAGQFVTVRAPGVEGFRAYSMTNFGSSSLGALEFVVKRKPAGGFSEWLFGVARDGEAVECFGPVGVATFHPPEDRDLICVAGGSGVAGMLAILRHAGQSGHYERHTVALYFGVRTFRDVFFLEELLQELERAGDRLRVTVALSDESAHEVPADARGRIEFASGFVHEVARSGIGAQDTGAIAYVAGPPPMVDATLRVLVADIGLPPDRIRYDKFS
ncbi:MAG: 2Fe-2S iron-sulfur cluster binding domain-containing protein [Gammaproteobacteria bacterium]